MRLSGSHLCQRHWASVRDSLKEISCESWPLPPEMWNLRKDPQRKQKKNNLAQTGNPRTPTTEFLHRPKPTNFVSPNRGDIKRPTPYIYITTWMCFIYFIFTCCVFGQGVVQSVTNDWERCEPQRLEMYNSQLVESQHWVSHPTHSTNTVQKQFNDSPKIKQLIDIDSY